MVFSSFTFLLFFLPLLAGVYFLLARTRTQRNLVLLGFSVFFYACGGVRLLPLLLLSILINHFLGRLTAPGRRHRQLMLWLAVALNLGLLFIFKYLSFTTQVLSGLIPGVTPVRLVLPIGISFYTFQGMSYVLDVYRGDVPPEPRLRNTALYITLFPQLVAGPIVRYQTIAQEIHRRRETLEDAAAGGQRFAFGLAKKVLLANQLGLMADSVFSMAPAELSVATAWLAVLAYTLQIYFDFSGYSDMAIGLGRIFGFHFLENFRYPYISQSITEFWRRWHISLGTWFRDYVYIPLGGNRRGPARHIRGILVVWTLTGIWHGANWTFLLWGLYYAVLLIGEKYLWGTLLGRLPALLRHLYALLGILVGWVLFRAADLSQAAELLSLLFGGAGAPLWDRQSLYLCIQYRWDLLPACILCCPAAPRLAAALQAHGETGRRLLTWGAPLLALGCMALSLMRLAASGFNPFIYFQF